MFGLAGLVGLNFVQILGILTVPRNGVEYVVYLQSGNKPSFFPFQCLV